MQKTIPQPAPTDRSDDKEKLRFHKQIETLLDGQSTVDRTLITAGTGTWTEIWSYQMPPNSRWKIEARIDTTQPGGTGYGHFEIMRKASRGSSSSVSFPSATVVYDNDTNIACAVKLVTSAEKVVLQVKDDGSATMNWKARIVVSEAIG